MQVKHNPAELIDFSIQPVMFLLLFTYVFGGAIGGSPHAYLEFALSGIIVQNSLFTTLNTATGLSTDLEKGFFDRLRSLPIARFAPPAALVGRAVAGLPEHGPRLVRDPLLINDRTIWRSPDRHAGSEQLGGTLRVAFA